ncbi:hypothetical protein Tco_1518183 [Tanacetum coccineum]
MPCSCDRREMWDRRVSIGQTSNDNSGLSILKPPMERIIEHYTGKCNHSISNEMVRNHDEREIKRDPWGYAQSYTRSSGLTTLERSKVLENKHHPKKLKTNAYFPSLPPCFKLAQSLTKDTHEPFEKDPNDFNLSAPNSYHEDEEVSSDKDVDE